MKKTLGAKSGEMRKCVICEKDFYAYPYVVKKGLGKYCSLICYSSTRVKGEVKKCLICENRFYVNKCFLDIGQGKFCSSKCYGKHKSATLSGSASPYWRGGRTPEKRSRLNTTEWKEIKAKVHERDKRICARCGIYCEKNNTQCDHIIPWRLTKDDSINNLQTLCRPCHIRKDLKFIQNESRACVFTVVDDRLFYAEGTHIFINSFKRFHPEIDLIVFRQDMIDKVFAKEGINFYQAKPYFGEIVARMGYGLVVNMDADHIITGRMTEVFDKADYVIGMPENLNEYENASFENITEEMYLQAGMVASRSREFWAKWKIANREAMKYLRKENDVVNLLIYNDPEISKLKLKVFDKKRDYYGCKSLGCEAEFYIKNGNTMCRKQQVKVYHFARGGVFPKLDIPNMPLNEDVKQRWMEIANYGQTITIGKAYI